MTNTASSSRASWAPPLRREGARPTRPAEVTNSKLPVPVRPFQRRRLRNVRRRQDGPRVYTFKYVCASKPFQIPHDGKRALTPFDDTPESPSDTHYHHRPERSMRFLHLSRQFQPRISLSYQRPQMVITPCHALHVRPTRWRALHPRLPAYIMRTQGAALNHIGTQALAPAIYCTGRRPDAAGG